MAYVITQNCCNDAACVPVCPVNCIHPTPDEPDFSTAEMLYIDPSTCIDCGACLDVCPVGAIAPDYEIPAHYKRYEQINALYYQHPENARYSPVPDPAVATTHEATHGPLRVAIVGSGPAACYAAEHLLSQTRLGAEVDMFERLPTPGGLVRFGVAPDHEETKSVGETFAKTMRRKNVRLFLNTEVGRDITHDQLLQRYHAVVYAVGASKDRTLNIPGEELPGSHSATEFVSWYNGHPEFVDQDFDLSGERAVVLGNGNVALDVARILVSDVERLRETDIADHALEQLAHSKIREVVVVGRRGVHQAAFTTPELIGLAAVPGVDLVYEEAELAAPSLETPGSGFSMGPTKAKLLAELGTTAPTHGRRVVLRFLASPLELSGSDRVEAVRLARNELSEEGGKVVALQTEEVEDLPCGLVLRAVGYRGTPVSGLPFDFGRAVLPNTDGRVVDDVLQAPLKGVYTTGWIKRGPSGFIGTNKQCAQETVAALLQDYQAGALNQPSALADDVANLLPDHLDHGGWRAIDAHERRAGRGVSRPRIKLVSRVEMLNVARSTH